MKKIKKFFHNNSWVWALIGSLALWVLLGIIAKKLNFESFIANAFSASFLVIAALGQMMVITTGRGAIDLSIPATITLSAFLNIIIINGDERLVLPGVLAILAMGAVVGFLNSVMVVCFKIPPMIGTIAMGYILSTISLLLRGNMGLERLKMAGSLVAITRGKIIGINNMVFIAIAFALLLIFIIKKTTYGWSLIAMGQNYDAACLAGIRVKKVEILTYVFSGILSAIAGLLISVRVGGAFLGMGDNYLLETVGGVVVGGTLISGGKASPVGTVIGCFFLTIILTAMQVAGVNLGIQNVIKGCLIILVIAVGTSSVKKMAKA